MALANHEDLEVRLGVSLSSDEQSRADDLLNLSSALVMEEAGSDDELNAPVIASIIAVEVAARVWTNPSSVQSESLGASSVSYGPGQGLVLTEDECRQIRKGFRGGSTLSTMQLG